MKLSTEVTDIMKLARKHSIRINQALISSDTILLAILEHGENTAIPILEAANVNLVKLKNALLAQIESNAVILDKPVAGILPLSDSASRIFNFAKTISSDEICADSLLHGMYQDKVSVAYNILIGAGYSEEGGVRRHKRSFFSQRDNTPITDRFSTDLVKTALAEKLDPVIGRDREISQLIEILARRKKNNPIIIGEPGVGKTSLVEGLVLRIINGTVPDVLVNKRIISLNLTSIVAGTMFRGQYEERMNRILLELRNAPNTIVFIDEIHTLMGNGGSEGIGDAAQIIKPALTNGTLRCIGATTLKEYRQHIEKDGALERRFQQVIVDPPSIAETQQIIQDIKFLYEGFHSVSYSPESLKAVVSFSDRYIADRKFPDKAIDILDASGANANLRKSNTVESSDVQEVIAKTTGIPVTDIGFDERARLLTFEADMNKVVIGQNDGIKAISNALKRIRTGIRVSERPISFLFLGGTGIGKTETARQLAKHLFGTKDALIRIDMSEYMEKFSVSRLVGAPPGYVGYEEGGQLTEKVRRKPYSVVLLDEIEKAHPDVFNILLQVFDDGYLTDSTGRRVSFSNTIIIITSNIGTERINAVNIGFAPDNGTNNSTRELKKYFRPEFLNRLDEIIYYQHLNREHVKMILDIYVGQLNPAYKIVISPEAKDYLCEHGYSKEYGARPLRRLIEQKIETAMADLLLKDASITTFNVSVSNNQLNVEKGA